MTSEHQRYRTLLLSLALLFLANPVMERFGKEKFWSLLFIAQLLFTVYAISRGRRSLLIAIALVTPGILGEASFFTLQTEGTHLFAAVSVSVFLAYVAFVVFNASVLGPGKMTADRLAGAISVYLLLGLLWAMVYGIVAMSAPGSFSGTGVLGPDDAGTARDFIYFSFVTLTTLGYGDILPVASGARTLAWMEAVFGQLYVAVTIARLVSLQVSGQSQPSTGDGSEGPSGHP
ncbi:MAG: potassium channel family protein [Longimicrobiales bacterium]